MIGDFLIGFLLNLFHFLVCFFVYFVYFFLGTVTVLGDHFFLALGMGFDGFLLLLGHCFDFVFFLEALKLNLTIELLLIPNHLPFGISFISLNLPLRLLLFIFGLLL